MQLIPDLVEDGVKDTVGDPAAESPIPGVPLTKHFRQVSPKSRQGAPVLQIQIIPSNDMRLSLPFLLGLPGPPGKIGSMRFHCRSLKVRITSKQGHSPHHVAMK